MKIHPISLFVILSMTIQASVEHKDEFIDTYLSNISNSMDEKTQLIEHILKNPDGRYIDIGTGGDSVAIIAKQLPKNSRVTLIAADIDPLVLESIKKRRPEINSFLHNFNGPKVELMTMSATEMDKLSDSSLSGVGASALAHEIYSYVPNKSALDQFISETCRVLEKDGILVYRDPTWVDDPETRCIMTMKSEIGKYYSILFLTKFLDRKYSLIKDYRGECCKPSVYNPNDIKIIAYKKSSRNKVQISFVEFLNHNCSEIDFSKNFSIEAPKGLLAEIQRHYLMYIRNYYVGALFDQIDLQKPLQISTLQPEQQSAVISFAQRKGITIQNDEINPQQIQILFNELEILRKIFSKGYLMSTKDCEEVKMFAKVLLSQNVDRNQFHFLDNQILWIDPKMIALLFQGKQKGIFQYLKSEDLPLDLLEHLKLEGEEHYFYKTTDDLITYIGQYSKFVLKDGAKKGYCLAPIDPNYIREAKRPLYQSILKRDVVMIDQHGNLQEPVTEKTIIHFQLQPERKAFTTYKKLIQENPQKYPKLKRWYDIGNHELLDLVAQNDVVIGVMPRTEVYAKNLTNFRVINAFVMNSKGELWIPIRHASKTLFPLALDCSVGGHVISNEEYFEAFCRESIEEIHLNPLNHPHQLITKLTPHAHGTSAFMEVYIIKYDGPIEYNTEDFASGQWIKPKDLKEMLKDGVFAKTDLKIILEACFPDV